METSIKNCDVLTKLISCLAPTIQFGMSKCKCCWLDLSFGLQLIEVNLIQVMLMLHCKQHENWNYKARFDLIFHCGDWQIQLIKTLQTSKELWDKLKATYEQYSMVAQKKIHKRLVSLSFSKSQLANEFFKEWENILNGIAIVGLTFIESQIVCLCY